AEAEQSLGLLRGRAPHLLLDAVRAEGGDLAAHVDVGLVDRVAEPLTRVAADHERALLGHEPADVPDRSVDHDLDSLHRDPAAGRGASLDHQQAAAPGRARGLAGAALDHDAPGHHVLGHPDAAVARDPHGGVLVHPGAVVADVTVDLDLELAVEAGGESVRPLG